MLYLHIERKYSFKVELHRKLKDASVLSWNGTTKIVAGYISMQSKDKPVFDDVRKLLLFEFEDSGLSKNNYIIFWQDKYGEWIGARNNAGFIFAMNELEGPDYKLIIQLRDGMWALVVNIHIFF